MTKARAKTVRNTVKAFCEAMTVRDAVTKQILGWCSSVLLHEGAEAKLGIELPDGSVLYRFADECEVEKITKGPVPEHGPREKWWVNLAENAHIREWNQHVSEVTHDDAA